MEGVNMKIVDKREENYIIKSGDVIITDEDKYLVAACTGAVELISLDEYNCYRLGDSVLETDLAVRGFVEHILKETIVEIIPSERIELVIK